MKRFFAVLALCATVGLMYGAYHVLSNSRGQGELPARRNTAPAAQVETNSHVEDSRPNNAIAAGTTAVSEAADEGRLSTRAPAFLQGVVGHVRDATGPIANAYVSVLTVRDGEIASATSASDGSFTLRLDADAASPVAYAWASKCGYWAASVQILDGSVEAPLVLEVEPAPSLEVLVVDDEHSPVSEARVVHRAAEPSMGSAGDAFVRVYKTDARGRVEIAPLSEAQHLVAAIGGASTHPWSGMPPATVTLQLSPNFNASGHVAFDPAELYGVPEIICCGIRDGRSDLLERAKVAMDGSWGPVALVHGLHDQYHFRLEGGGLIPQEELVEAAPAPGTEVVVDFAATRGETLWYRIINEDGEPLPEAWVLATWQESDGSTIELEAQARPDGYAQFVACPPMTIWTRAFCAGYSPSGRMREDLPDREPYAREVTLEVGGEVRGRCLHQGLPVLDFELTYWLETDYLLPFRESFSGRENGDFVLCNVPSGHVNIFASSPAQPQSASEPIEVSPTGTTYVELHLPSPVTGSGRVVDASTNAPISGAVVQPKIGGDLATYEDWGTPLATDGEGRFRDLPIGALHPVCEIIASGYARARATASERDGEWSFGVIRLFSSQTLTVHLQDASEASDYVVTLVDPLRPRSLRCSLDGIARFQGVDPGWHSIDVRSRAAEGQSWQAAFELVPGEQWEIPISVGGVPLVVEVVSRDSAPPEGTLYAIVYEPNTSRRFLVGCPLDGKDVVKLPGLRPGAVQLDLRDDGRTIAADSIVFDPANPRHRLVVGASEFRLRVVDGKGEPVPGALLGLVRPGGLRAGFLTRPRTDSSGECLVEGISGQDFLIYMRHDELGYRPPSRIHVPERRSDPVELVLDASFHVEVRLRDGDAPVPGLSGWLWDEHLLSRVDAQESASEGELRWNRLGSGRYRLRINTADYWPVDEIVEATVDGDPIEIQARRLGRLALEVRSSDGSAVTQVPVSLRPMGLSGSVESWIAENRVTASSQECRTDDLGRLEVEQIPNGDYQWSIEGSADGAATGVLTVRPGKVTRAFVTLP